MSNKRIQEKDVIARCEGEKGFSLMEAVVAILVVTIGLIGTAAAVTFALELGAISRNVTQAKLVVTSTIEEIETLRNSKRLHFKQIENVGGVDNTNAENPFNGFSTGFKPISMSAGPDGVSGTDDDLLNPGVDMVYGNADDFSDNSLIKQGYQRQIIITNLAGSPVLKKIEVRIQYPAAAGKFGQIVGVGYLNDEFRITR